jgi:uncharacterized protein
VDDFRPGVALRAAHVQTLLASVGPRTVDVARRAVAVSAASHDWIVDCGGGVRLLAQRSCRPGDDRDLVVLLHGWEGSSQSQYLQSSAAHLYDAGLNVVRLNLRDHGPTHHLNRELFHSCRLEEVVGAVAAIAQGVPHRRLFFWGYSLGGNFGLRLGLRAPAAGIDLSAIVAICPVLDPEHTMRRLESGPWIYRRYFERKWSRSLRRKAAAWPGLYDFSAVLRRPRLGAMTRHLVEQYTEYAGLAEYLRGYAVVGDVLQPLNIPTLLLAALDDPIIPAADLFRIARPESLTVDTQPRGGHCGFLESLHGPSWAERRALEWIRGR